jgi:acetylornithine/succinyldiaminopimelate/putrescine aminotransferase
MDAAGRFGPYVDLRRQRAWLYLRPQGDGNFGQAVPGKMSNLLSQYLRSGLEWIKADNPEFFRGIRQNVLIMGLEFAGEGSAIRVMQSLYKNGVWAIYSHLDNKVLQFKPGVLCTREYCDELLAKMAQGIKEAR